MSVAHKIQLVLDENKIYHIDNKNLGGASNIIERIDIKVKEQVEATLIVALYDVEIKMDVHIELHPYSTLRIVYKNNTVGLESREHVKLHEGSLIHVGYMELSSHKRIIDADYELMEPQASAHIVTTTLAKDTCEYQIRARHKSGMTYSNMENYGICDVSGKYHVEASGIIDKGSKGSKSHQSTRVLTLADKESVNVTPLLLIDENDVEASHACSIGEMNEDHLYYLETKGLSKKQALALLTLSYVLPITKVVEHDETLMEELSEEVQSKVGL